MKVFLASSRLCAPAHGLCLGLMILLLSLVLPAASPSAQEQGANPNVRPPVGATAPEGASERPGNYDAELWRKLRGGLQGGVSIPDKKAGQLVQSQGEAWRNLRNGPLALYGAWGMAGILVLLALFFLVRGRIRVEHGLSGTTMTRFTGTERMGHWLMAVSFIILALTGLNLLYGRYVLLPVVGKETFAGLTHWGKLAHNYVAFGFMAGLLLAFLLWVRQNLPNRYDFIWLLKGGGMFTRGVHPPARKFNAGQKILFWLVVLGGLSISLSGISLLFPFETAMFAKTFAALNTVGFNLPTKVTPTEEMQYAATWHAIVALFLICVIIAHIYIGTLGMQGAFSAMGSGEVDVNWAKEHHSVWAQEELAAGGQGAAASGAHAAPAE